MKTIKAIKTWQERIGAMNDLAKVSDIHKEMQAEIDELRQYFDQLQRQPPAVIYQGEHDFRFTGMVETFQRGTSLYLAAGAERSLGGLGLRDAENPPVPRVERRKSGAVTRHAIMSCDCAACQVARDSFNCKG